MGERPGRRDPDPNALERALSTSAMANSTAFGYSIMITVTFGMVSRAEGPGSVLELFAFAVSAALGAGAVNAALTRGFRRRLEEAPPEIEMLGTAMNLGSVGGSVGLAFAAAELLPGLAAWAGAAVLASVAYIVLEALEILLAEKIQASRGDPDAKRA